MRSSATVSEDRSGVLLVGHGTRNSAGIEQFLHLTRHVVTSFAPLPVEAAFLELAEPTIDTAVGRLIASGVQQITTIPVLLFAAGHAKEDIPRAVQEAVLRCGLTSATGVEIRQIEHLGCHPAVVELSRRRLEHAVAQKSYVRPSDCLLLLVGRGSHDADAIAEMQHFGRLRHAMSGGMPVEIAFLAMAQPLLPSGLTRAAASGAGRVIVQPHLLFEGELVASIEEQVMAAGSRWPKQEWIVTRSLADPPDQESYGAELLAKVIRDRYHEELTHVAGPGRDG